MKMQIPQRHYLLAAAWLALACDNRDAWHAPHPGLDRMAQQPRVSAYASSTFFGDGRAMRPPPPGTIPRERAHAGEPAVTTGRDAGGYLEKSPITLTRSQLEQGRASFDRICATCHGVLGDGVSVVAEKMQLRKPPSLFEPRLLQMARGELFAVISRGYGLMPDFASALNVDERWAVVAYVDALRLSQAVQVAELPPGMQRTLQQVQP